MPRLLLVGSSRDSRTDNLNRLCRAFHLSGWRVEKCEHNGIWLEGSQVLTSTADHGIVEIESFDLLWLLGFGSHTTFLDRMQLLQGCEQSKFVNSISAFVHLHNKAAMNMTPLGKHAPYSISTDNVSTLLDRIKQGGSWIVKPTAGSFGRDVFALARDDPNLCQIIEHVTRQGYVLLQEKVSTSNEKRWMLIQGETLGVYEKVKEGLRGNVAANAKAKLCEPDVEEYALVQRIAANLLELGIRACAIDLAYPYLLDVNFVNPGWFQTMEALTGEDLSRQVPALFASS